MQPTKRYIPQIPMLVFQMHASHARHGTTFDPNPPPFAPLMDSTRPTKQIAIPTLSVTVHSLLLASSPLHSLVVIYLETNLQVHSPNGLFLLQLGPLSEPTVSRSRQCCLKLPEIQDKRPPILCYPQTWQITI